MLTGILGASGDVGLASVRALLSLGLDELRLGGRDAAKGARCLAELQRQWPSTRLHWATVDCNDARALAAFADGCQLLLN